MPDFFWWKKSKCSKVPETIILKLTLSRIIGNGLWPMMVIVFSMKVRFSDYKKTEVLSKEILKRNLKEFN